jgi:4-hydroxy-tetrahydrodipicolinate reductase
MIRIILHGCCGRMGRIISGICAEDPNTKIMAGVDAFGEAYADYPVYRTLAECPEADVVIDFSNASAVDGLLDYCVEKKLPVVVCTTGLTPEQTDKLNAASEKTAVLKSANMSLGINLIEALLAQAAPKLAAAGFDIEIVEKHHNQKVDAPSGTALALADAVNHALSEPYEYVYDRSGRREKRPVKEIGISAVRGGTIVGDHDVIFAGQDEVITFSHRAYSRAVFGKGAVEAAKFLAGKGPGFYTMSDVLN